MDKTQQVGIIFPQILIPEKKVNKQKWSVIACDQFTSHEDYWIKTSKLVGGAPSAYHIIVPEAFVEAPDIDERVAHAKDIMRSYIEDGVLVSLPEGLVLVERETPHGTRVGLVLAVDLEQYDTDASKKPLIRATEKTVSDRMTVRIALRQDAVLECPHVMLLLNDASDSVIGPVYRAKDGFAKIYDTALIQGGGRIKGWFAEDPAVLEGVTAALAELKKKAKDGMLFAVGDGNHSLSAAKQVWESAKISMSEEEQQESPLRYALVEVVNLFDHGISMHPIHRVVFDVDVPNALRTLVTILNRTGQEAHMMYTRGTRGQADPKSQAIRFESKLSKGYIEVKKPRHALVSQTLTEALDILCDELARARVDYIHGDEEFRELAHGHAALGFLMDTVAKEDLFEAVVTHGVLPKKAFSLGNAEEKRYYFESRLLVVADDEEEEEMPLEETAEDVHLGEGAEPEPVMDVTQDGETAEVEDSEVVGEEIDMEDDDFEEEDSTRRARKPKKSWFGRKRDQI